MPTASGTLCATHTPQEELDTVNIANFSAQLFTFHPLRRQYDGRMIVLAD